MRKLIIRLFNLIFIAGAAIAIVGFATKPLVSLNVQVAVPATTITSAIPGGGSEEPTTKEIYYADEPALSDFDISELLTEEVLAEEGIEDLLLNLNLSIVPESYKDYFDLENNYEMLYEAVMNFIDTFIDNAYDYMQDLMMVVAKIVAKDVIADQVKNQIKEHMAEGSSADDIFANSGCEEQVDQLVDKVLDEFEEGNVPISDLAATITNDEECGVKGILTNLRDSGVEGFNMTDEQIEAISPEQIQDAMSDALSSVPGLTEERPVLNPDGSPVLDEDGNPVTELIITDIPTALMSLLDILNGESGGEKTNNEGDNGENIPVDPENGKEGDPVEKSAIRIYADDPAPADPTPASKEEELKQKVTDFILKLIPFDIYNVDYSAGGVMPYILVGIILLGFFPWALFALVTIIRTLRKRKCWTKTWIVFVLAFTQLIFGVVLTLVFKFGTPAIMSLAGNAIPAEYAGMLGGLTVDFSTAAFWGSIVYLAMIPLAIVYKIICHKTKKEFRQFKKDKKAA